MDTWQLLSVFGFGFVLGLQHALDADHIITVSTIASHEKNYKKIAWLGLFWGAGHITTLLIVAMIVLLLKINIPTKFILGFEFLVGIMLVLLGFNVFRKLLKNKIHWHAHQHDGAIHSHRHSHKKSNMHKHHHWTFIMGMIHGIVGSAALMILVVATLKSFWQGIIYVLIFGMGSIISMMIISGIISIPFFLTKNIKKFNYSIQTVAGLASIVLGIIIMYRIIVTV